MDAGGAASNAEVGDAGDAAVLEGAYSSIDEHYGCVTQPCCQGGSGDTDIEVESWCKYAVRAFCLCGCYQPPHVDPSMDEATQACIGALVQRGECPGMNSGSIGDCDLSHYVELIGENNLPPFDTGCSQSSDIQIRGSMADPGDCE